MRVAVLGQGSIGRRHAGLLVELGHEVVTYDPAPSTDGAPAGVEVAGGEEQALDGADAAVVASPTSEHAPQAARALRAGVPVLVEKPLALDAEQAASLAPLARASGAAVGVAMNLRFHPGVRAVRELVAAGAIGRVLHAAAWCGSWLPGWRPGTDYRQSYSARRELGGGVLLDAIHELDYLTWLLGPVAGVRAVLATISDLEIDVEDVALLTLEMAGGALATVSLDYVDRGYHRGCRIVGSEGTAAWSWETGSVTHVRADGSREELSAPRDVAATYRPELEHFLAAVAAGEPPAVGLEDAIHVLAIADAARRSAQSGGRVAVAEP